MRRYVPGFYISTYLFAFQLISAIISSDNVKGAEAKWNVYKNTWPMPG